MKKILWTTSVVAVCVALLAGRDDIIRFRAMHGM
jgi:hypothetical protein